MLENRKLISICSDYYSCRKRGKTQDNVDKSDNQTNNKGNEDNYEVANTKVDVKEYSEVDLYDCAKELLISIRIFKYSLKRWLYLRS